MMRTASERGIEMREIKFDAIYKPTEEHFVPQNINFERNIVHGDFDGEVNGWCHFSLDSSYGDAILRQYTGLKDVHGKKIYEGDIVHFKAEGLSGLGIVYWKDDIAQFWIKDIRIKTNKRGERYYPFYENARYRVDGNIYENQELLEKGKLK